MDHAFMRNLKGSVSCINFKGDTPLRCLDLGTGVSSSVAGAGRSADLRQSSETGL